MLLDVTLNEGRFTKSQKKMKLVFLFSDWCNYYCTSLQEKWLEPTMMMTEQQFALK